MKIKISRLEFLKIDNQHLAGKLCNRSLPNKIASLMLFFDWYSSPILLQRKAMTQMQKSFLVTYRRRWRFWSINAAEILEDQWQTFPWNVKDLKSPQSKVQPHNSCPDRSRHLACFAQTVRVPAETRKPWNHKGLSLAFLRQISL